MKLFLELLPFLKPSLWLLAISVIFMAIGTILEGASFGVIPIIADKILANRPIQFSGPMPAWLGGTVNQVNAASPLTLLTFVCWILPVVFCLKGVAFFYQQYFMGKLTHQVMRDIRNGIYSHLQSLSFDYFNRQKTGELMSRILNDVDRLKETIADGIAQWIYQALRIVLFSTVVFFISWKLALLSMVGIPLVALPFIRIAQNLRKIGRDMQEKVATINQTILETLSGIRIVQAFSKEDHESQRFRDQNEEFYRVSVRATKRMAAVGPLTETLSAAITMLVLYIGGRQVIEGTISFGVLAVFLGALLSIVRPFKKLSQVHAVNQIARASLRRIMEILRSKPSVSTLPGAPPLGPVSRQIEFQDVDFAYDGKLVLHDISIKIPVGKVIAFVGPSGAGKTTLLNLVPRFYDPTRGRVRIDGRDSREVDLKSLRDQIGLATQDLFLFSDSVLANIAYGESGSVNRDRAIWAAKMANAHDFIMALPHGYDTKVGERGYSLSGGQRQRLCIARAVFKDPPILILDEATSHLDSESERLVQESVERLMIGRTVLVIAHRLSTVQRADAIYVLDHGRLVESGTHAQLVERGGLYRKLYDLQFNWVEDETL